MLLHNQQENEDNNLNKSNKWAMVHVICKRLIDEKLSIYVSK